MTRQTTIDLPANANSNYPLSETLGGTGVISAPLLAPFYLQHRVQQALI